MKPAWVVFLKEVRENLRDRRTMINTLVTGPLMAPQIFVLLINTLVTRELERAEKALPLPVIGAENAPNLVAALKQQNVEITPPPAGAERAVRDQSTPQSRSGNLFAMLPYFFILGGFIGGMALAIDTTAGERERQSLEPLLANPVPRWQLLAGKLGATTAFAIATVLLSIVAFAAVGHFLPTEKIGMSLEIGVRFVAKVL